MTMTGHGLRIDLTLQDPAVINYLQQFPPDERPHRLEEAARIGILALNAASGGLDATAVENAFKDAQARFDQLLKDYFSDSGRLSALLHQALGPGSRLDLSNRNSPLAQLEASLLKQLSLDHPESAVSRLKAIVDEQSRAFQGVLGELRGRRDVTEATTRKGRNFEKSLYPAVCGLARGYGDLPTDVTQTEGPDGKVGDFEIQIGADGPKMVVECKKVSNFKLHEAQRELQRAKKNRSARVGIFVFAAGTEPAELGGFQIIGRDIFCVVDEAQLESGVIPLLDAAYRVARAHLLLEGQSSGPDAAILRAALKRSLDRIEKMGADHKIASDAFIRLSQSRADLLDDLAGMMRALDKVQ